MVLFFVNGIPKLLLLHNKRARKRKSRRERTRKAGGEREQEQERQGRRRQTTSVKACLSAREDAQDESG